MSGIVVLFFAGRLISFRMLGFTKMYDLSLTFILAAICIVSQVLAARLSNKTIRNAGIVGVLILTGKVVFRDMMSMDAAHTMGSLGALTAVFVVTSIFFRWNKSEDHPDRLPVK